MEIADEAEMFAVWRMPILAGQVITLEARAVFITCVLAAA